MLKIYNTLSREKQEFKPLVPGQVRMYVCGMTVYDYCHLGHARVMVVFDMVTRWLRAAGYQVTYVRNITDIDDKIIKRAAENKEPMDALTARFIAAMERWNRYFVEGADLPVIGATEAQLRSIAAPACVVPGNDNSHPRAVGENLARLLPRAELQSLGLPDYDLDLSPRDEWTEREPVLARFFTDFMARVRA